MFKPLNLQTTRCPFIRSWFVTQAIGTNVREKLCPYYLEMPPDLPHLLPGQKGVETDRILIAVT